MDVGNYIIRSAISEDIVLLTEAGSKSKGAKIVAGAFTESDCRCYWKCLAIRNQTFNQIHNILSGKSAGNMSYVDRDSRKELVQSAYKVDTGAWDIELSGETMKVNGIDVPTYFIKLHADQTLYVTAPENGGDLYLETLLETAANQEFYFEPTTYYDPKIATPTQLVSETGNPYIISDEINDVVPEDSIATTNYTYIETLDEELNSDKKYYTRSGEEGSYIYTLYEGSSFEEGITYYEKVPFFYPQWTISKTDKIYEYRYRSRCYDLDGNLVDEWNYWSNWEVAQAEPQLDSKKKFTKIMRLTTSIPAPSGVNNKVFTKAEIQVQVRLTNAKTLAAYNTNKSNNVTHGPIVSQVISVWCIPELTMTAAIYSPDGLALTYSTDYTVSGSSILINYIMASDGTILLEDYTFTGQDYIGDLYLNCDELYSRPEKNDTLSIMATIIEENGVVYAIDSYDLVCEYANSDGLVLEPGYTVSSRKTIIAVTPRYDVTQCFLEVTQIDGSTRWVACEEWPDALYDELENGSNICVFEIPVPFNKPFKLMWVCVDSNGAWTSKIENVTNTIVSSNMYTWNWTDENGFPRFAVLKYQVDEHMKPEDSISLQANKFITTGREYPVFRYSKSVQRRLNIEGVILDTEEDIFAVRSALESLATANHCVYRQPSGKWYQVAIQSISFTVEDQYTSVVIVQEAETR